MKICIKGVLVLLCVFLLTVPASALDTDLNGRWVSLQYGALTFTQNGNSFTAVWTGTKAAGTITGRQASFRFWSGASFEECKDDSRGYGTLTLSQDGSTLNGTWANLSKKEPESGSFIAMRMSLFSGQTAQDAAPVLEEAPGAQSTGTEPAPPDAALTADEGSLPAAAGSQTSSVETASATPSPDGLILLPEYLPSGYLGPIIEVMSELEESVLKIFDIFDDGAGDEADSAPPSPADTTVPDNSPPQDAGDFWDFFVDLWTSLWGQ